MRMCEDQARSIFLTVVDKPPEQWPALLDAACSGDAAVRARVEQLLRSHRALGSIGGETTTTAEPSPATEGTGTAIGPYKLIERIGEGGMGTVWLARQTEPVARLVAIKLIKAGMDSAQVVARFEAERQALALMDHPNIARVLDGGTARPGRPYFVMDLVKGAPITKYCDEHRLTLRQRLELFVPVCHAVQHAHQKGIIHRDLKPSNVLVAVIDGKPVPKVIDFGVAKATGPALTDRTLVTGLGAIVGTLEYMSPEQAEINSVDIDTRSDVYSLGALLYELLTGGPPFTTQDFERGGVLEMLRVLREQGPPRPSTRLSNAAGLAALSATRSTEPARLTKLVRGELDWIAMKALEKDRDRRYETANGFAADVRRYLADEPVEACPPTVSYRLRKFARRHRGGLTAAALVALTLVAGAAGTAWQAVLAEQGRSDAERARREEAEARSHAERAAAQARDAEADYLVFSRFLVEDVLCAPRPHVQLGGRGVDVTVKQALLGAAERMSERFHGRPRAEAVARHDLGVTLRLLGEFATAEAQLRIAWKLRREHLPANDPATWNTQNSLAVLLMQRGKVAEAIPLLEDAVQGRQVVLGPDHPHTLATMDNLADAYRTAGRLQEAVPLFEQTLARMTENLGPNDTNTIAAMNNTALAYGATGRTREEADLLEKCVKASTAVLGPDNPETLTSMHNLALACWKLRQPDRAIPLLEKVVELRLGKLSLDHPHTLSSLQCLAFMYTRSHIGPEFLPCYRTRLPALRQRLSAESTVWVAVATATADVLLQEKKHAEAEPLLLTAHEGLGQRGADTSLPHRLARTRLLERLVALYSAWGKTDEADTWRKRLDEHRRREAVAPPAER